MQILQAHYGDFVPRYQIFMFDDSKIDRSIPQWQEPTTVWDGKPVLGFMAETFLDDLSVIGLGFQSNVDISYNVCESMLGSNDIRYASMACW